jgi:exosome complex component MTR3
VPKSSIDVYVNVLENDGTSSSLAAAISAASVALADAGIEMYDQVAASSIVSNRRSGLSLSKVIEQIFKQSA